jgi:hypothetical protein
MVDSIFPFLTPPFSLFSLVLSNAIALGQGQFAVDSFTVCMVKSGYRRAMFCARVKPF